MPRAKKEPQLQEEVEKLRVERQLAEEEVQRMAEEHMNALLQHVSTVERIKSTVRHSLRSVLTAFLPRAALPATHSLEYATRAMQQVARDESPRR